MAVVKLTKSELKRQREALTRFNRYLPMLQLKKQQLQSEILKIHRRIESLAQAIDDLRNKIVLWVDVFAQELDLTPIVKVKKIKTGLGNVAGIEVAVFLGVEFEPVSYDFLTTPLWVDNALAVCREEISLKSEIAVCHQQIEALKEELRVTTQRVNLFEKIKIPQARENIRVINIYTGELQKAGVVRGKIAKSKINKQNM